MRRAGGTLLANHFTTEVCREYQYDLSSRGLQTNTVRVRLATLGSFGKWAVRRDRLLRNPVEALTRPRRRARLPRVPRWEVVERLIANGARRDRALVALMAYGGLRRSEVVSLNVGDFAVDFGLGHVCGKGAHQAMVPLPRVARDIVWDYVQNERANAAARDPMFVVRYRTTGGVWREARMSSQRLWKVVRELGKRAGMPELHPHAFRHGCGVELLRRTGGNLRVVQEHLRHADIQTTTIHTRLTQGDLQKIVGVFDEPGNERGIRIPSPREENSGPKN
jgi:site-specific recombinase XerD